jgi:hypothetical protein
MYDRGSEHSAKRCIAKKDHYDPNILPFYNSVPEPDSALASAPLDPANL